MKTLDNVTTFDHVMKTCPRNHSPALIAVQFEGDWELWFTKVDKPDVSEIAKCIQEVRDWYDQEWHGCEFEMSVLVTPPSARFEWSI